MKVKDFIAGELYTVSDSCRVCAIVWKDNFLELKMIPKGRSPWATPGSNIRDKHDLKGAPALYLGPAKTPHNTLAQGHFRVHRFLIQDIVYSIHGDSARHIMQLNELPEQNEKTS